MKNYLKLIQQLPGEGKIWAIAYRKRKDKLLFEGDAENFVLVPNSFLYWRADPFFFDYRGKTYLFAELFNRIMGKGVIGVAEIKNGECGCFKVCISEPYHLSYPCVFQSGGEIYMVPESGRSGSIVLYKCKEFPYKWEKVYQMDDCLAVDTTPVPEQLLRGGMFLSTINHPDIKKNGNLWLVDLQKKQRYILENGNPELRSAGHIIVDKDRFIRPVQNCRYDYGTDLIFKQLDYLGTDGIGEHEIDRVFPSSTKAGGHSKFVKTESGHDFDFEGIHTYNISKEYEVIDLAYDAGKNLSYIVHKVYKHFRHI